MGRDERRCEGGKTLPYISKMSNSSFFKNVTFSWDLANQCVCVAGAKLKAEGGDLTVEA